MIKLTITQIGPYKDHWALVYVDLNPAYSAGGGRLTVITDDFAGSAFFSHVAQPTFNQFIAQCDEYYLTKKLFPRVLKTVPVQNGEEFFEWIAAGHLHYLKEARRSGEVSKKELRLAYEEIEDKIFNGSAHLYDLLSGDSLNVLSNLFGDDWWWDKNPSLPSVHYEYLTSILRDVITEFKKLSEVSI